MNRSQTFRVKLTAPKAKRVTVVADYCRVDEQGNIAFRNARCDGYPQLVRLFASGQWQDVEVIG